jgi:hypothetical protein
LWCEEVGLGCGWIGVEALHLGLVNDIFGLRMKDKNFIQGSWLCSSISNEIHFTIAPILRALSVKRGQVTQLSDFKS